MEWVEDHCVFTPSLLTTALCCCGKSRQQGREQVAPLIDSAGPFGDVKVCLPLCSFPWPSAKAVKPPACADSCISFIPFTKYFCPPLHFNYSKTRTIEVELRKYTMQPEPARTRGTRSGFCRRRPNKIRLRHQLNLYSGNPGSRGETPMLPFRTSKGVQTALKRLSFAHNIRSLRRLEEKTAPPAPPPPATAAVRPCKCVGRGVARSAITVWTTSPHRFETWE